MFGLQLGRLGVAGRLTPPTPPDPGIDLFEDDGTTILTADDGTTSLTED